MTDWAAILAEYGPRVWQTAFRVLSHDADAHDCYQETFLAAWQLARTRALSGRDWAPLLTCLATRKAVDRLRKRFREAARTGPLDAAPEPAAAGADPSQSARAAELVGRLRARLAGLPEKQAHVVWLSCVEGLSHPEIAEQLGLPPAEVRVLLHRGRARLAQQFASELTEAPE
jgi:RNA polymerase sigma-70 factor (ECF subfamily)